MTAINPSKLIGKQKRDWQEWELTCQRIHTQSHVLVKETSAQKKRRIKRLLDPDNFQEFIQYYFASDDFSPAPLAWFHKKAIDNLLIKRLRKHIWEWHRESAKSVFADIFLPIHMLIRNELTGMILSSESEDKAKNLLKDIEAQLRHNQKLIHDFGEFNISGSWLSGFFQTGDNIGFWAFGLGQNPAGVRLAFKRPNLGIVDDADNKDKAKNQKLTLERLDWIKGEFMGCLAKDNRYFIYLNNRVHKQGITAHLVGDVEKEDKKDESFAHIKACLTENPQTHEPIYPEGFTHQEVLDSLIQQGAVPAWKEYYSLTDCVNKIIDYGLKNALRQLYHNHLEQGGFFTPENLAWVDPLPLEEYDGLVSYCDPAFGESGKGSFKAVVLVGKIKNQYHVLWVWLRQKGNWVKAHRDLALHPENIAEIDITNNSLQKVIQSTRHWVEANELQRTELNKTYALENQLHPNPWYPRYDRDKKADKIGRIESLEPLANHHHLKFNSRLKSNRDMRMLRDHFLGFPSGFIDGPDAVQGAISKLDLLIRKQSKRLRSGSYLKRFRN